MGPSTSVGRLHYDLDIDDKRLKGQLDRADKHVSGFGSKFAAVGKKMAIGMTIAGGAAVAFAAKSVKSFQESQNAQAQLAAVLKSTHNIAGLTIQDLNDQAAALQRLTKYSDEEVNSAQALLLTFTDLKGPVVQQATDTVLDMSTALGQDLKSSSIQLGKALQDPILGITALRRVGVNFSDKQKDVIAKLVETGQKAKAQQLILKELRTEFGGSAIAAGETFAGKLAILKNSFDEIQESIGGVILTALAPLGQKLADFVSSDKFQDWIKRLNEWLAVAIPKTINYFSTVVWPQLVNAFNAIKPIIQATFDVLKALFNFVSQHTWIITALALAFVSLKVQMMLKGAYAAFAGVMAGVRAQAALTSGAAGIGKVRTAITLLKMALSSPLVLAVAVGFALTQIKRVFDALNQLKRTYDNTGSALGTIDSAVNKAHAQYAAGKISKARYQAILRGAYAGLPGFATGGIVPGPVGAPRLAVVHGGEKITPPNQSSAPTFNIGQINNQQDENWVLRRLDRNLQLESMGLSPVGG